MTLNIIKKITLPLLLFIMISSAYSIFADETLVGLWKSENVSDHSGNGNDLTLSGDPTITSSNCRYDNCYDYDNTEDYASSGITGLASWNELTFSGWVFLDASNDVNGLFGYEDTPSGSYGSYCYVLQDNSLTCKTHGLASLTSVVGDTTLTHIAYTLDRTGTDIQTLYINGIQISSSTGTATPASVEDFKIGYYTTAHLMDGKIDDVTLWNKSLNSSEVYDLYLNGVEFPASAPTLDILVNVPTNNFNYTYDVSSFDFDVGTNYNASCTYQDTYNNGSVIPFTSTGFLSHSSTFTMGVPVNQTLQYDFEISCFSSEINDTDVKSVTVYRQSEPLEFDILIPADQQVFDYATSEITFYMLTNYVANCEYLINNDSIYTTFDNTDSSVHTHSYIVPNETYVFNTNFSCYAPYVNESDIVSLTFFIEELAPEGMTLDTYVEMTGLVDSGFEVVGAVTSNTANLAQNELPTLALVGVLIFGFIGIMGAITVGLSSFVRSGTNTGQVGRNFRK